MNSSLPFAEASERNKGPILEALAPRLPRRGVVLEVGSGTGQHVVHFAPRFERLSWLPSERRENLPGLDARIRLEGCERILPAIELDVFGAWPDRRFAAAYSANTAHILSWAGVGAMFEGVGSRLAERGCFFLYGPFNVDGDYTAASNRAFDLQLREQDPEMGLRDIQALDDLAQSRHMALEERVELPANNQLLVFRARRHPEQI